MSRRKLLLTGATGFVGSAVVARLMSEAQDDVVGALLSSAEHLPAGVARAEVGDIGAGADWPAHLEGVRTIIHCAARVHVMRDDASDPLAAFRRVNVEGTLGLARAAVAAGVQRLVFISSIKVNGEATRPGRPFTADDVPAPADPYAVSKLEAEQGLRALAAGTGLEVVVVRPPLVYGPGVKANFASMIRWIDRGVPLPLGAIRNERSLVALDNLVDLLVTCARHPAAAGQTFLVSDGRDLSTTELLRAVAAALGRPARLLPVPAAALVAGARLVGKAAVAQRLCGSLHVDITKTREVLGWRPPVTIDEGLARAVASYQRRA